GNNEMLFWIRVKVELTVYRFSNGSSLVLSPIRATCSRVFIISFFKKMRFGTNIHMSYVLMAPKFQPTTGGSRRRNGRPEQTHQLQDEDSEFE
ncbi:hypothetical protein HAX54_027846, partial [Datura stramonium]|nr:hypothetical protein [Datura stramonium]